ncbi:hypothetical protein DRJ48_00300 [Candidatus Woesearchaeota archaeon]|nr:hypothetical protein [Candidatus Woesearchaeota archaeon]RLE43690.1 MAG: hypothetical protein DRJ48_00300 [Candidatus Woesearchaeota archaeon]
MEKFQEAQSKAEKSLRIADHMLFVTYPLVKDDKLLISILENIFISLSNTIASVLYYERLFKRIPPFHDTFDSKFHLFVEKIMPRYKIDKKYRELIERVHHLVAKHKHAPVEFTRGGKYVICTNDYNISTLSVEELKEFVREAKELLKLNNRIIEKNAYIFK